MNSKTDTLQLAVAAHLAPMPSVADIAGIAIAPTEIHLIPAGQFAGRDGRGMFQLDAAAVAAAFTALGMPLAIDYEHQSINAADNGQPAPAAGWITAVETREDGLWGTVEWTDKAAAMIAAREYRYLSPVFNFEANTGRVVALIGAGLTNHPNLHLTAINRYQGSGVRTTHHTKETPMDDILERLRYLFNLPTLATEADIAGELAKLSALLVAPETAAMRQSLSLPDDARLPQLMTAVAAFDFTASAAHKAEPAPDITQFVPRAEYDRLLAAHKAKEEENSEAKVTEAVEAALNARKIAPASKEWAVEHCRKDPEGFARFVAAAPVIIGDAHNIKGDPAAPAVNPLIAEAERRK